MIFLFLNSFSPLFDLPPNSRDTCEPFVSHQCAVAHWLKITALYQPVQQKWPKLVTLNVNLQHHCYSNPLTQHFSITYSCSSVSLSTSTCIGSGNIAPCIPYLSTKWRCVVSFIPQEKTLGTHCLRCVYLWRNSFDNSLCNEIISQLDTVSLIRKWTVS
jgi:hypothetical protein